MSVEQQIFDRVSAGLQPSYLSIDNESHMHSVPPNSETHFKLVLVSAEFQGLRPVARHQRVYSLLTELMQNPIHALALHTYAPDEWSSQPAVADSPDCLGGGRN